MTDDEYAGWERHNERITVLADRSESPCVDCVASWARAMRSQGRCDGEPGPKRRVAVTVRGFDKGPRASAMARRSRLFLAAERAWGMYLTGMDQYRIAEEMGIAQSTVSRYIGIMREAA